MMRFWKISGLGLLVFCLLYAGAALDLSAIPLHASQVAQSGVPVYLRSDGGHLDLLFPVRSPQLDWTQVFPFPENAPASGHTSWIAIGWGEKGFYLDDTRPGVFPDPVTTFRAASGLSTPVLHIAYVTAPVVNDTCRFLYASQAQYHKLTRYVLQAIAPDAHQRPQWIAPPADEGPYVAFYEAKGTYSIFNTCNTWVNSALKYAGMKACIWTPLARAVLNKYPV